MSEVLEKKGSCLCGSIKFVYTNVQKDVAACHCGSCKKWGGGPYFSVKCGTDVSFEGEENISIFDSSDWAVRGFCKNCGTHLFYRFKHNNEYRVPLGLIDDEAGLSLENQYFVDIKSNVYQLSNQTNDLTAAEVFAKFSK